MSQQGPFRVERRGEIAWLTLDDGKANVLLGPEFDAMDAALAEIEKTDAGAVVFTGRPRYFTAGLNLKVLPGMEPDQISEVIGKFARVAIRLFLFPKPVVAAVTGHGLGAGGIFAFASDVRLFAKGDFKFGLNEVPGGLMIPSFGVEPARAVLNPAYHLELIVHGRVISPDEAKAMGIADSLHAPEELADAAQQRAERLATLPGPAYRATKRTLRGAAGALALARLDGELQQIRDTFAGRGSW